MTSTVYNSRYYFTEKIVDAFLTGTIPIYCGCPNIADYFDPKGIFHFQTLAELRALLPSLTPQVYESLSEHVQRNFEKAQEYTSPDRRLFHRLTS